MSLASRVERLAAETERQVTGLWDRVRDGQVDEDGFVRHSARTVNRANARATGAADQSVAADLRRQTGRPVRPAGIRPQNEQGRLEGALRKIIGKDPEGVDDPDEIHQSKRSRLGRLARNEPSTAAQNTTRKALDHHSEITSGWVRTLAGPDNCPLCRKWADGKVRSTKVKMLRHPGCNCQQRPVAKKAAKAPKRRRPPVDAARKAAKKEGITGGDVAKFVATGYAVEAVTAEIVPRIYGRTTTLAGGRRRYRLLKQLESIVRTGGTLRVKTAERAAAIAERKRLIEAGIDVERNVRELEYLEGGFLHQDDVYAFLDDLAASSYTQEELDALWDYAGLYTDDPDTLIAKGPVIRYHRKLRNDTPLTEHEENVIRLVDQAIARNRTTREAFVWRGAILPDEEVRRLADLATGERIVDKAPMFTGLTEARAFPHAARREFGQAPAQFETHGGVMFHIRVPEGMPAMSSPYGLALAANPRRLPFLLRGLPGVRTVTGTGGRKLELPIGLLSRWLPIPEKYWRKTVRIRVPFVEYFNKEELILPRNTALRVVRTFVREDGLLQVEVEALIPSLSPPLRPGAGRLLNMARPDPAPLRSLAEVAADLRATIPHVDVRLGQTTQLQANQMLRAVRRMQARYPDVMVRLEKLHVADDIPEVILPTGRVDRKLWEPGGVGISGPMGPIGQRYSAINPVYARNEALLRDLLTEDPAEFAMRDMEDVVIHELAHHVHFTWVEQVFNEVAARRGFPVWPDPADADAFQFAATYVVTRDILRTELDEVIRRITGHSITTSEGYTAVREALSKYALSDLTGQPSIDVMLFPGFDFEELVAEAFTQVHVGRYARDGDLFRTGPPSELARAIVHHIENRLRGYGADIPDLPDAPGPLPDLGGAGQVRRRLTPGPRIGVATPVRTVAGVPQRLLPPGEGPAMHPDLIPDKNVAKTIARLAKVPGFEDFAGRTDRGAFDEIMARMATNILVWAERHWALSPDAAKLHAEWYPRAHHWLNSLVDDLEDIVGHLRGPGHGLSTDFPTDDVEGLIELHGSFHGPGWRDELRLAGHHEDYTVHPVRRVKITRQGAYAVTAALSPRADWANNVAWAKRVIEAIADDVEVAEEWIQAAYDGELQRGRKLGRGGGAPRRRTDLIGRRLSEIDDVDDVAYVLKAWHDHEPLHQLGGQFGFGDPVNIAVPNDMENIAKAVSVARDSSVENIDRVLGGMKVRSFYNNLANPLDAVNLEVTIDTHHYGVAFGLPYTSSDPFMSSGTLNVTDTPWSDPDGIGGAYPLVVEATRRATEIFNELHDTDWLPNQLQSVVWEMHRADYPSEYRTLELLRRLERIRTNQAAGRITHSEALSFIELARLQANAPRPHEIVKWFEDDLANRPRRTLTIMRRALRGRNRR